MKTKYVSTDPAMIKKEFWLAVVIASLGVALFVAGFVVPPLGAISPSVLTAGGELLTFSGSVIGIDTSYKKKRLQYITNQEDADE